MPGGKQGRKRARTAEDGSRLLPVPKKPPPTFQRSWLHETTKDKNGNTLSTWLVAKKNTTTQVEEAYCRACNATLKNKLDTLKDHALSKSHICKLQSFNAPSVMALQLRGANAQLQVRAAVDHQPASTVQAVRPPAPGPEPSLMFALPCLACCARST
jgi:hypothetical protein